MKVYLYHKCSTCKGALAFLNKNKIAFIAKEITEEVPTREELEQMLGFYQGDIRKLFNTSGILYRELNLSQKLPTLSKDQAFDLLSSHGMLVKRPFLIDKKFGAVGFNEAKWKELLANG